jgi:hypothetical protein
VIEDVWLTITTKEGDMMNNLFCHKKVISQFQ